MHKGFSIGILLLSIIPSIIANNNPDNNNSSNEGKNQESGINVSLEAIAVGFSDKRHDSLGTDSLSIKKILLMAKNYCLEKKIDFPYKNSDITIFIGLNDTATELEVTLYCQHDHQMLTIIIKKSGKVLTHYIRDWSPCLVQ